MGSQVLAGFQICHYCSGGTSSYCSAEISKNVLLIGVFEIAGISAEEHAAGFIITLAFWSIIHCQPQANGITFFSVERFEAEGDPWFKNQVTCFTPELLYCYTLYPLQLNINKTVSRRILALYFHCLCPFSSKKPPGALSLQTVFEVVYPRDHHGNSWPLCEVRGQGKAQSWLLIRGKN